MYVCIPLPELPPMSVQYTGHVLQTEKRDNNTALPLVGVMVTSMFRTHKQYYQLCLSKMKNY